MNREHKYKDKDEYKDNDKDKDAERITESLNSVLYFRNPEDSSIPSLMVDTSPLHINQYRPILFQYHQV